MIAVEKLRKQYQDHVGLTDEDFQETHGKTSDSYRDWLELFIQPKIETINKMGDLISKAIRTEERLRSEVQRLSQDYEQLREENGKTHLKIGELQEYLRQNKLGVWGGDVIKTGINILKAAAEYIKFLEEYWGIDSRLDRNPKTTTARERYILALTNEP